MPQLTDLSEKQWELRHLANCLIEAERVKGDKTLHKKVLAEARKMLKEKKTEKSKEIKDLTQLVRSPKKIG